MIKPGAFLLRHFPHRLFVGATTAEPPTRSEIFQARASLPYTMCPSQLLATLNQVFLSCMDLRIRIDVSNAEQHTDLLRTRTRTLAAVVGALRDAEIGLVVCTHALQVCLQGWWRD